MTVWVLDDDDDAIAASEEVGPGDLVVRRTGESLRIGVAQARTDRPVDWRAEVDLRLLPERDLLAADADDDPLVRLEDVAGLERALHGVLTAERDRGA